MTKKKSTGGGRKANAPRGSLGPIIDPDTKTFTSAYVKFSQDMEVCYTLVAIAAETLKKKLTLVAGGPMSGIYRAATDGSNIFLPKMHPNRRIAVKHELAHIYFGSDIPLRLAFVTELIDAYAKTSPLTSLTREHLTEDLCFFINVIDDVRVNSLWGILYPGAGRDMDAWYSKEIGPQMMASAKEKYGDDIDHLFTYAILLVLGQQPYSTKWGRFRDAIVQAVNDVYCQSFKALLVIVKRLVTDILRELAKEPDPPMPGGLGEVLFGTPTISKLDSGARPPDKFSNDNAGFDYKKQVKPDADDLKRVNQDLHDLNIGDPTSFLDVESTRQMQQANALQQAVSDAMQRLQHDHDAAITRRAKADINLINVTAADVVPTTLSVEERLAGERWKTYFRRVMAAMRSRVSYVGYDIVAPLYLHQKLTHQPLICYRRPQTGRGFNLTILVDMSGSMTGDKFAQVEKLYRVLQLGLDFPFVNLRVLGFNSTEKGTVNIYRFPRNVMGLRSTRGGPDGVTPLSIAIHVAGQDMLGSGHEGFLFVLSDGLPVYQLKGSKDEGSQSFVSYALLRNWTANTVEELRRQRIRVFCFMIGHRLGSDIPRAQDLNTMFGDKMWRHIHAETLFDDGFNFVKNEFLRYLQTR